MSGPINDTLRVNKLKDKINILFIIDQIWHAGGTETHLARLVKHLNKERFKSYIVTFDTRALSLIKQIEESGTPVIHIPVGRYYTWNAFKKGVVLSRMIKRNQIDIVQTYHFKSDTYGALIARLSGVKRLVSSKRDTGDLKAPFHFLLNRLVNPLVKGIIVVADAVGQVVSENEKLPSKKLTTIYNGVDLKKFQPPGKEESLKCKKKLGLEGSDFIIGTVAWFRPEKNYAIFFEAVETLSRIIPNLKVVALGDGPLLNTFKELSEIKGFSKFTLFPGGVDDVRPYLNAMDVACLVPGENEGFSNSVLEKMATGLPLVVTDIGGNSEAVVNGYNGIVIPPNDSRALAEAIVDLYNHPEKRKAMGANSRKRVEELFSIEKMVQQYEAYYEKIMTMP